jgi:hypothetical protein
MRFEYPGLRFAVFGILCGDFFELAFCQTKRGTKPPEFFFDFRRIEIYPVKLAFRPVKTDDFSDSDTARYGSSV